mgnify:CR=1 FL=1
MSAMFNLIASAIGSAIQAKGAKKAASENTAGQQGAADYALDNSMPWDVTGSLGGASFDKDGKVIGLGLSEDFAKQQKGFLDSADKNRGYLNQYEGTADEAAQRYYDQQMEIRGPEQEAEREALDAQLQARGMLGSTGGIGQAAGLSESQGLVNMQGRMSAEDRVQGLIDTYRARISGDVQGAGELGKMPLAYAQLGVDTGGMLSPAAMQGSQYLSGAALAASKGTMGRYNGIGNAFRSFESFKQRQANIQRASGENTMVPGPMFNKSADNSYI